MKECALSNEAKVPSFSSFERVWFAALVLSIAFG